MRIWGLVTGTVVTLALAASPARAEDPSSFEALAQGAVVLNRADIAGMVWALTATCDGGDEMAKIQCKAARDGRVAEIKGATMLVDGDAGAFSIGPWNPDTKSVAVTLRGCIACVAPVGGLYLVSAKYAPSFKGDTAEAAIIHETARTFSGEAASKRWGTRVSSLRSQFVVRIATINEGRWERDGKKGIAFDILGFRVWDPCDGGIVCASPSAGQAPVDKKTCGETVIEEVKPVEVKDEGPELPQQLSAAEIKSTMAPVAQAARRCFDTYGVPGKAKLHYAIAGDGSILTYEQTGDFVDTPTGKCIDKVGKALTFPKSKKKKFVFAYPLNVQ